MDCHEATTLLQAYGDGELDPVRSAEIEKHLTRLRGMCGCAVTSLAALARAHPCRGAVPSRAALRSRARALACAWTPPFPLLRRRGRRETAGAGSPRERSPAAPRPCSRGSSARPCSIGEADHDLVTEAVANHARATLGNRSDRGRFVGPAHGQALALGAARLLAAGAGPRRRRLSAGRRAARLSRPAHPVATLVYRYRQHTIDVFVRPLAAKASEAAPPKLATQRGFNVVHESGSGMEWWAVSDVNSEVLTDFLRRLARGT